MNEKRMIEWARKRSQAAHEVKVADAKAQREEWERAEAQKLAAEMSRRGITDPVRMVSILRDEAREANERREALLDADADKADAEDAETLEFINEWRAEDDLPAISSLFEASEDELEAACQGNPNLLARRKK